MNNAIVAISGMRGKGKTTLLRSILSNISRVLICDTLAEHKEFAPPYEGSLYQQLTEFMSDAEGNFTRSAYLPVETEKQSFSFELWARMVYAVASQYGRIAFAVEEIDYFSRPNAENDGLNILIQYGRHAQVDLIYTTRSLVSISRKLTSETDTWLLFRQQEPRWLDALADRVGDEIANEVEKLEPFSYIHVRKDGRWEKKQITAIGANNIRDSVQDANGAERITSVLMIVFVHDVYSVGQMNEQTYKRRITLWE